MRTRVKICGITRPQDAQAAVLAGCDALGFVFHAASPRNVSAKTAAVCAAQLPPFVSTVALFMNAEVSAVNALLSSFQPDYLQFHGDESEDWCQQFGLPFIKAVAMGGNADRVDVTVFPSASALLLDGHRAGQMGGSGEPFDWDLATGSTGRPVILAGGLNPGNVQQAITCARPFAVDVSSGVEIRPGEKDAGLMQQFIRNVEAADD